MSKSRTTTEKDWLHNEHAGEMLWLEFMEPAGLTVDALAGAVRVSAARVRAVIDGAEPMSAELDLRLGRYFGLTEGYFLRLQNQHDLLEAKRTLSGELDRITDRAA